MALTWDSVSGHNDPKKPPPVITIKSNIDYQEGKGTEKDPYTIETSNNKFGSYVKLDNTLWRIYQVNETDVRLMLNDYLKVDNENDREQRYKETIRNGNPESLIGIIKMTYIRKKKRTDAGKKATAMDERYLEMAENNLYSELAFAINRPKEEVCNIITEYVEQRA